MKLLVYKPEGPKLEEIAVDINLNPVFLTAIEMIDDEVFLGADGRHVFVCQKNRFVLRTFTIGVSQKSKVMVAT